MSASVVKKEVLEDNKQTIHSFLSESYSSAKKHLDDGVQLIHDGFSAIKDEFSSMYGKTGEYLTRMASPVNNFLKDFSQIENEMLAEFSKAGSQPMMSMDGQLIPVEQVLKRPMEENY